MAGRSTKRDFIRLMPTFATDYRGITTADAFINRIALYFIMLSHRRADSL